MHYLPIDAVGCDCPNPEKIDCDDDDGAAVPNPKVGAAVVVVPNPNVGAAFVVAPNPNVGAATLVVGTPKPKEVP